MFKNLLVFGLVGLSLSAMRQGVGLNEDNSSPDSSAILDVKWTTKGVLIPRMTRSERTAISTPAKGLLFFDDDRNSFWFFDGVLWQQIGERADTDDQTLSLSATDLSIEDGNTINLSSMDTDVQTIDVFQFDGTNLEISLENNGTVNYGEDLASVSGTQDKMEDADEDTKTKVEESTHEDYIRFDVAGNEPAVINNSGQIDIGTDQPSLLLEIKPQGNNRCTHRGRRRHQNINIKR